MVIPKSVEKRISVTAGWTRVEIGKREIVEEDDFVDSAGGPRYKKFFRTIVERLSRNLANRRVMASRAEFVLMLIEPALPRLVSFCNSAMPAHVLHTNVTEYVRFIGTILVMSTFNGSPETEVQDYGRFEATRAGL